MLLNVQSFASVSVCSIIVFDFVTDISHLMLLNVQSLASVSVCSIIIFDLIIDISHLTC